MRAGAPSPAALLAPHRAPCSAVTGLPALPPGAPGPAYYGTQVGTPRLYGDPITTIYRYRYMLDETGSADQKGQQYKTSRLVGRAIVPQTNHRQHHPTRRAAAQPERTHRHRPPASVPSSDHRCVCRAVEALGRGAVRCRPSRRARRDSRRSLAVLRRGTHRVLPACACVGSQPRAAKQYAEVQAGARSRYARAARLSPSLAAAPRADAAPLVLTLRAPL